MSEGAGETGAGETGAGVKDLIEQFNVYRYSHPNLSQCWLAYIGLKKRHYNAHLEWQCNKVLDQLAKGHPDLKEPDLIRLLLYKHSV